MNDLFSTLFGKPIDALTEQDLTSYFTTPRKESDLIEYKSYNLRDPAKETEKIGKIVRSVDAMLNSGGGIIIWGAPQPTKDPATQEHIVTGSLSPVDLAVGSDRFMEIVVSSISPSSKGIRFEQVTVAGGFVYLVVVPASEYPPHQYDGRYYARFDSLSKPASHHYVEALMKQVKQPRVEGFIEFGPSREGRDYVAIPGMMSLFNLDRNVPAMNLRYEIVVNRGTMYLEEDLGKTELANENFSIKVNEPRTLINNMPLHRKFCLYAPVVHTERLDRPNTIDLIFWADNVVLHFSRYRIVHTVRNYVQTMATEILYESRPAFEIVAENGQSEQELIRALKAKGITAFTDDFYRTPLGKKLLD